MIRLMVPDIGAAEAEAVEAVLRSGALVQGSQVASFEQDLAARLGAEAVVAVSSGTSALHLALLTLDLSPGDEVAIPTYSWPATANAVVLAGGNPVFVDIDATTYGMQAESLKAALSAHPRIRSIMPVHAFGGMADMAAIRRLADASGIPIVEDAACALGASLQGAPAGTWGRLGCFSFHPRKIITTGEGGAVVTNDPALARRLRRLRNHGLESSPEGPRFIEPGFNQRMTEFQAALGGAQLRRLDGIVAHRRELACRYAALLADTPVTCPAALESDSHTYQSYVVLLPNGTDRAAAIHGLRQKGIEATIGTYHIPLTQYYAGRGGWRPGDFPVTDDVASRAVTLPLHHQLSDEQQRRIVTELLALIH